MEDTEVMIFAKYKAYFMSVVLLILPLKASALELISIGAPSIAEVGAVCRLVNKQKKEFGVKCSVQSRASVSDLAAGRVDFIALREEPEDTEKLTAVLNLPSGMSLLARDDTKLEAVYHIARTVYSNFSRLGELYPNKKHTLHDYKYTGDIPIHAGALQFYSEVGLIGTSDQ